VESVLHQSHRSTALVTGAAGFIGSHLVDRLLARGQQVIGIDNLSRGSRRNLRNALAAPNFSFHEFNLNDLESYRRVISGARIDMVWHMAANSDIPAGVSDPQVDLRDTFFTTFNTLQIMREHKIKRLAFASTSAVYGVHQKVLTESTGPLFPISNYGAMKLASEAIVSAAVESFLECAWIFRLSNITGSRATHGVVYDLLNKLKSSAFELEVLGDGKQRKPYLHATELLDAMELIVERAAGPLNCFNIGPADPGVTVKYIAEVVCRHVSPRAAIRFTGGSKGWTGDVPRFEYSIEKLRALGWSPLLSSEQAIARGVDEIHSEMWSC
jgi:UDP-glucose 4-epimerase